MCAGIAALSLLAAAGNGRAHAEDDTPPAPAAPPVVVPPPEPGKEPPPAVPMLPDAKVHYDRGLELYRARDFAGSIRALEQGFALEPRREFLFAEAQAWRLAGDCARAIVLYQRFIDSGPQAVQAQAARLGIDRCAPERTSPAPRSLPPQPTPGQSGPTPPLTPIGDGPAQDQRPRWWRDPWVLGAGGLGVVALGVGATALVGSNRSADQAQSMRTTSHTEFDRLWNEASQRRTIALVGLAAGAGLVAAGGLRALWLSRQPEHAGATRLSLAADGGGATLLWQGLF